MKNRTSRMEADTPQSPRSIPMYSDDETRDGRRPAARRPSHRGGGGRGWLAMGLVLAVLTTAACEDPFDVDNPNNATETQLDEPASAPALVNGAQATVSRAASVIAAPYSVTTDELTWIGSRDAWNQMNFGRLDDPNNEFSDDAFDWVAQGRFMADRAIDRVTTFDGDGTLEDRTDLARAYLYGGIIYTIIGDVYDDFVLPSTPTEEASPIGGDNMSSVYDQAITYLTEGLSVARDEGDTELEVRLLAMRARAQHARAVWEQLNPAGSAPADPLVDVQAAVDDAQAVLNMIAGTPDWTYRFTYSSSTVPQTGNVPGFINVGFQVNQRGELQIGPDYVDVDSEDPTDIVNEGQIPGAGITLMDPIDDVPDPAVGAAIAEFIAAAEFAPFTVVSAREMHLIIAEAALAGGDDGGSGEFASHVNAVRSLDGLSDYTGPGQIDPVTLLEHERRVNLYLQVRRLADHYRFESPSSNWLSGSAALRTPGTFFPISISEIRSNPNVGG